jgi:CHRD domain/PEP-CTERM motif
VFSRSQPLFLLTQTTEARSKKMMKKLLGLIAIAVVGALFSVPVKADPLNFIANYSGSQEVPVRVTPGTGVGFVTLNGNLLSFSITFTGLTTPTVDSHIHCCAPIGSNAGVAVGFTSTGFPLGVTSGSYSHTFDLTDISIYKAAFLAANGGTAASAAAALTTNLVNGLTYLNIHTTQFPGGEIRGQVQAVPEPTTMLLLGAGLATFAGVKLRRRQAN